MKLLILTQKIDINDPVLGFFHRWAEEFAKHCDKLTVICLQEGEHHLPPNVKVLSLGKVAKKENAFAARVKQQGEVFAKALSFFARIKYSFNFYKYILRERKNYDSVFVHMNSEYVVLGGALWRLWGKKIMLWNNHMVGNLATRIGVRIAHKTFYTSPFSFNAKIGGKKGAQMPVGIDTEIFKPQDDVGRTPNSLLLLGRISPVKRLEIAIGAVKLLDREGKEFVLSVVGDAEPKDNGYFEKLKESSKGLIEKGKIKFLKAVPNHLTPRIYGRNDIFINTTNSGSLDKTIMESLACGSLVVTSNRTLDGFLSPELMFEENNQESLKEKIFMLMQKSDVEKNDLRRVLREKVVKEHGLDVLIERILRS